jgi:hypothetical protein
VGQEVYFTPVEFAGRRLLWGRAMPCGGLPGHLFTPEERGWEPRAGHGPAPQFGR